jgi:Domain of unknown function (DUF4258)
MDKQAIKSKLRSLAQGECLRLTKHCREMMRERSISTDDFLWVLFWGDLIEFTEDKEFNNYKCEIRGKDLDGEEITLQVAILEKDSAILCITVYG